MTRRLALIVMLACGAVAATAAPARAQASLGKAKELYAAASYDEALVMLNTLGSSSEESDAAAIAMYRVLCLVAVGRTGEVDTAIDRLVAQHPLYRPPSDEKPPSHFSGAVSGLLSMTLSTTPKSFALSAVRNMSRSSASSIVFIDWPVCLT